jgi:hypothetical protein
MALEGTNGTKLVWWILGIVGAVLSLGIFSTINTIDRLATRINALEISLSVNMEHIKQMESLAIATRNEQIERTLKFGDIANRISVVETSAKILELRIENLGEKLTGKIERFKQPQ